MATDARTRVPRHRLRSRHPDRRLSPPGRASRTPAGLRHCPPLIVVIATNTVRTAGRAAAVDRPDGCAGFGAARARRARLGARPPPACREGHMSPSRDGWSGTSSRVTRVRRVWRAFASIACLVVATAGVAFAAESPVSATPTKKAPETLAALWTTVLVTPSPQNPFGTGDPSTACWN